MPSNIHPQQSVNHQDTYFYVIKNKQIQATITNYGARLVSLLVPDRNHTPTEINIGFDSVAGYLDSSAPYYGATIGRFANRIARGKFTLNECEYTLAVNNGLNNLHSGKGFHEAVWQAEKVSDRAVTLTYLSTDGEEGFPGNLWVTVTYTLTDANELKIDYEAAADAPTVINLTNHAYFNLNGVGSGMITGHRLIINADGYLPVDETQIPTGEICPVENTPFDFRQPHTVGLNIDADDQQLRYGNGYDHNYVLNKTGGQEMTFAALAMGDQTGIQLEVWTTEPGIQFYAGNFMDGSNVIKGGYTDGFRTAFALETQHFPDSPNQPQFPSTVLEPGTVFKSTTCYKLSIEG
jgi:aldose 1-epimerase